MSSNTLGLEFHVPEDNLKRPPRHKVLKKTPRPTDPFQALEVKALAQVIVSQKLTSPEVCVVMQVGAYGFGKLCPHEGWRCQVPVAS